jgi:hypothetical protein
MALPTYVTWPQHNFPLADIKDASATNIQQQNTRRRDLLGVANEEVTSINAPNNPELDGLSQNPINNNYSSQPICYPFILNQDIVLQSPPNTTRAANSTVTHSS